jgi:dolichol-phosphate mannosyltransferase
MSDNLQILLPVYNEADHIENLLIEISNKLRNKIDFSFIISEDGSNDGTKEILLKLKNKLNIRLIIDNKRKFYSRAVIDGIKIAKAKYLMIMDSDGQCDPKDIIKFWEIRKESDLVNGYRFKRQDFMYRKIFSNICLIIYRILFNVPLRDPSFAFILMSRKVYKSLSNYTVVCPDGFFWEFNARAKKLGYTFAEIEINHRKRSSGQTKIYNYKNLPRIAFNHLIGLLKVKFQKFKKNVDKK